MFYLKRLWYRKWMTLIFSFIFILLFMAIPYGIYHSWESKELVTNALDATERGSYDLLVRNPHAPSHAEINTNSLANDWIGYDKRLPFNNDYWKIFAADPRIELAAPISFIGFFAGNPQTLVLPKQSHEPYQIDFLTTDGTHEYVLDSQIVSGADMVTLPPTYHMLVAVDPVAEQRLTGIDFSFLKTSSEKHAENAVSLNVLQPEVLPTPLTVRLTSQETGEIVEYDLQSYLQPFTGGVLELREDGTIASTNPNNEMSLPFFLAASGIDYYEKKPGDMKDFRQYNGVLKVPKASTALFPEQVGFESALSQEVIPHYRYYFQNQLDPKWSEVAEAKLVFEGVETFSPPAQSPGQQIISPLGIYYHAQTLDRTGASIVPTALGGSFVPQVASGITTMDVARELLGDGNYISAVRIKVAGTKVFNENSRKKIMEFAQELMNQGYGVQVLAGSAANPQLLDVAEFGLASTTWLKGGIVNDLVKDFNRITFTTLVLFTIFSLIWLTTRLQAEASLMAEESDILTYMGWNHKEIKRHELFGQQVFLISLNLISLLIFFLLGAPPVIYFISLFFLVFALSVPYFGKLASKLPNFIKKLWDAKRFSFKPSISYYWRFYLSIILLLWMAYAVLAVITASQYRVILNFNSTGLGQTAISPVTQIMLLLLVLTYLMTIIAIFESISVILQERKEEFLLYQKVGWTERQIYFYLVKESFGWVAKPLFSVTLISAILSMLLSYIFGVTIVILIASFMVMGLSYTLSKRIKYTGWFFLVMAWAISLLLGLVYSQDIVLPTILITFLGLTAIALLIIVTLYFSLKKFYRSH